MKTLTLFIFTVALLSLISCTNIREETRRKTVLAKGSKAEVEAEALRAARADIAAGRLRICYCDAGFGAINRPVAVPEESLHFVSKLARIQLPSYGCFITEEVARGLHFGTIYNREVLRYLLERKDQ
jgi:hypothetical protein